MAGGDTAGARATLHADYLKRASTISAESGGAIGRSARSLALVGDTATARTLLAMAIARSAHEYVREDDVARTYFALGDREKSIEWWTRSVESNGAQVIWLATLPELAPLRTDPRVQALLVKAGVK